MFLTPDQIFWKVEIMERYAAVNEYGEIVSKWFATEAEACLAADAFMPSLAVTVAFSEWAEGKPLTLLPRTESWDGHYPVVWGHGCEAWTLTGEIVSAQDEKYTVTDCGMAVYDPAVEAIPRG